MPSSSILFAPSNGAHFMGLYSVTFWAVLIFPPKCQVKNEGNLRHHLKSLMMKKLIFSKKLLIMNGGNGHEWKGKQYARGWQKEFWSNVLHNKNNIGLHYGTISYPPCTITERYQNVLGCLLRHFTANFNFWTSTLKFNFNSKMTFCFPCVAVPWGNMVPSCLHARIWNSRLFSPAF